MEASRCASTCLAPSGYRLQCERLTGHAGNCSCQGMGWPSQTLIPIDSIFTVDGWLGQGPERKWIGSAIHMTNGWNIATVLPENGRCMRKPKPVQSRDEVLAWLRENGATHFEAKASFDFFPVLPAPGTSAEASEIQNIGSNVSAVGTA